MSKEIIIPPCRPYILKAMYDWLVDVRLTPLITVDVNHPDVVLPLQFAQNGIIVLNISPMAVRHLEMDKESLSFGARFGGVPHEVFVPMIAVTSIYAEEDPSLGMYMFPEKAYEDPNYTTKQKPKPILAAVEPTKESELTSEQEEVKDDSDVQLDNVTTIDSRKKPSFEIVE